MANSVTRKLLIEEAKRRNWRVSFFGPHNYLCKITDDMGVSEIFRGSRPLKSSANGFVVCRYKNLTMEYASSMGYKVPAFVVLKTGINQAARDFLQQHKTIVVKPVDSQQSLGVTVGVTSQEQLEGAVKAALTYSESETVILQEQLQGRLYRLLVINGKLVAAAHRKAAEVTGDGKSTVGDLIDTLNSDPLRSEGNETPLKKVKPGEALAFLGDDGLAAIPAQGEVVRVSALDSVSVGGEAINVTAEVHQDWKRVVTQLAQEIQLFVCGYDVICPDISQPMDGNFLPLLEINSAPDFKLHYYPTGGGEPIDLAPIMLDEAFGIAKNK